METATDVQDAPTVTDEVNPSGGSTTPDPDAAPPAPPSDEPAPAGQDAGSDRPRDERGRFTAKQDTAPAAPDGGQPSVPAAEPSPAVAAIPEPFVLRADGQRIPIPDAALTADGDLVIKASQVPQIRQLLAEGVTHRGSWRRREAEYQEQVRAASVAADVKAKKYNEAAVYLYDLLSDPAKLAALTESPERIELVKERLALMLERHDLQMPVAPRQEQERQGLDPQAVESAARATLDGYIEELLERREAKAVYDTPEKRQALAARLQRRIAAYFVEEQGQILLHENAVDADFEEELQERWSAHQAAEQKRKADAFNAKRNAPVTAPPVVGTKAPPPTAAPNATPTSREEWRKRNFIG